MKTYTKVCRLSAGKLPGVESQSIVIDNSITNDEADALAETGIDISPRL